MIPIKQTILHDPANGVHGNCLSAVIASLLHLDVAAVPLFSDPDKWVIELNAWLEPYGLAYVMIAFFGDHFASTGIVGCYHELSGHTVRSSETLHAVVGYDGGTIFDPHPDATGLTDQVASGVFVALRPWERAEGFDLHAHLRRQADFSQRTFGPGSRAAGNVDHIRKELIEIEAAPGDLSEWIDVVILALDGALRTGATPQQVISALAAKQSKNERRVWPDWRSMPADKGIEHDRSADALLSPAEIEAIFAADFEAEGAPGAKP